MGALSPRYVYAEIVRYEAQRTKNKSTEWLVFELIWRDYFRFISMELGDRIFSAHGVRTSRKRAWKSDPVAREEASNSPSPLRPLFWLKPAACGYPEPKLCARAS